MSEEKKKIILIIEDEIVHQRTLSQKLGMEGYETISAKNGEEGLALAIEKHPDLILLDLQMPKMNGIEMSKKLREDDWGKTAKIVVLTNVSDMSKLEEALDNDIVNYLIKTDIKIEDLVLRIKEMVK